MQELQLDKECPSIDMELGQGAGYLVEVTQPGTYQLRTGGGRALKMAVPPLPGSLEIAGPWNLEFPKGWRAPAQVTLEHLISWTDHSDAGVRYFSGTATYRRRFNLPAHLLAEDMRLYLDLGEVSVIAQARLNGRDLGILWKPPLQVDMTEAAIAGANSLEVDVVNLWPNRLVGDDHLPPDCEWRRPTGPWLPHIGEVVAKWPQWLLENKPSPTGRVTFTTWKLWTKNDPLLRSGLLGPVRIVPKRIVRLQG
jgi:hypothetical protein